MVLTGKQALDYSGGVSAEDNLGIGGYERIMGPNGQAQYWAPDLGGRLPASAAPLRAHLRRPRRALPAAAPPPPTRVDRDVARRAAPRAGVGLRTRRRHLLRRDEPGPQAAVRHPHGDARRRRPRPPAARALGRRCATPRRPWSGTRTSAAGRCACSGSSRGRCRATARARRRARAVDVGHAVPARRRRRSRGRSTRRAAAGRSSCWPTSPASTARPSRCATAARVRRRDRAGGRELRRADRLLRRVALPRRRVRGVLAAAQPDGSRRSRSRAPTPR